MNNNNNNNNKSFIYDQNWPTHTIYLLLLLLKHYLIFKN